MVLPCVGGQPLVRDLSIWSPKYKPIFRQFGRLDFYQFELYLPKKVAEHFVKFNEFFASNYLEFR